MNLKELFYNKHYNTLKTYDYMLSFFDNTDSLPLSEIYVGGPNDNSQEVLEHLAAEGMLVIGRYDVRITARGKECRMSGGYARAFLRKRIMYFASITAALTGLVSLIILLCKA